MSLTLNFHPVPESSVIIEYLERHYRGPTRFIPDDVDSAWQTRLRDRFYDLYVHLPMQKVMGDRLRPDGAKDPHGVAEARAQLRTSYAMIEQQMAHGGWAMGGDFSLADCAALPPLFYGNMVEPFGAGHGNVTAYFERLKARPSVAEGGRTLFPQGTGGALDGSGKPGGYHPRHFCGLSVRQPQAGRGRAQR
jgi:glutathione S-transferase